MDNRLYRSRTDSMLGGVCGGMGVYFRIDPTIIRILFILLTLAGGMGPLLYLILWVVVPKEGQIPAASGENTASQELKERAGQMRDEFIDAVSKPRADSARFLGIGLIIAGGILLLRLLNIRALWWFNDNFLWAIALVAVGAFMVYQAVKGNRS